MNQHVRGEPGCAGYPRKQKSVLGVLGVLCGVISVSVSSGCNEREEWTGTVTRLENGGTRVANPAEGIWSAGEAWTLEEELRIGSIEGNDAEVFGRITALNVDPAGRIWLIEGQAREVRVFGADGALVRTFGRRGEGPGELQQPGGLLFGPSGDLWIPDIGNRRYSRWDTAGTLIEEHRMDTGAMHFRFSGALTTDGVLYDVDVRPVSGGGQTVSPLLAAAGFGGGEVLRPVLHTAEGALPADTVPVPALTEPVETFSGQGMFLAVPFSPTMRWLADPRGYMWSGTNDAYRIVRASFAGDTTLIIERAYEPLPVTSADIEEWMQIGSVTRLLESGVDIDRSRIPSTKPIFNELTVDDAGYLWVRLITDSPGTRYDVFDPDGRYLGQVSTPDEVQTRPVIRGSLFYAVVTDELDVPYVVRYVVARR